MTRQQKPPKTRAATSRSLEAHDHVPPSHCLYRRRSHLTGVRAARHSFGFVVAVDCPEDATRSTQAMLSRRHAPLGVLLQRPGLVVGRIVALALSEGA